ncbi:MAG: 6,7-dimethyl-8-ribityllumazine synthase [Dehalococcoidia bacterium]|nr:6,7-dimethyl-8-ribityllumazine synthase [Dehalococcoidia bacterium]
MPVEYSGSLDGAGLQIAVVVARFNSFITDRLLDGAQRALMECGVAATGVAVIWTPGAFELPLVAQRLALSRRFDAVICLGCVIRGETAHFEHVAAASSRGILEAGLQSGIPVIFGVLTTDTVEQARGRCGSGSGNKGGEAARTAVEMANLMRKLPLVSE